MCIHVKEGRERKVEVARGPGDDCTQPLCGWSRESDIISPKKTNERGTGAPEVRIYNTVENCGNKKRGFATLLFRKGRLQKKG